MHINIKDLYMNYNDTNNVLRGINFNEEITSLALIGPSGGGKSTLLRIIGGLLKPSQGTISIDNEIINQTEDSLVEYRRKIGFVFQQNSLFTNMNTIDNIAKPLIIVHKLSKEKAFFIAEQLIKRFGLYDCCNKMPYELSGGQQQRVAIARAIASKPKLLLLDEPTSALDPEYTTEVLNTVKELKNEGIRFIIVTHEMGFAKHACDNIAFLTNGLLLEYGKSNELFKKQNTKELKNFFDKLLSWSV